MSITTSIRSRGVSTCFEPGPVEKRTCSPGFGAAALTVLGGHGCAVLHL